MLTFDLFDPYISIYTISKWICSQFVTYLLLCVSNSSFSFVQNNSNVCSISSLVGTMIFFSSIGAPITVVIGWRRGIKPKRPLCSGGTQFAYRRLGFLINWYQRPDVTSVASCKLFSPNESAGTSGTPFSNAIRTKPRRFLIAQQYVLGRVKKVSRAPPTIKPTAFEPNPSWFDSWNGSFDCDNKYFNDFSDAEHSPQLNASSRVVGNFKFNGSVVSLGRMPGNSFDHFE